MLAHVYIRPPRIDEDTEDCSSQSLLFHYHDAAMVSRPSPLPAARVRWCTVNYRAGLHAVCTSSGVVADYCLVHIRHTQAGAGE